MARTRELTVDCWTRVREAQNYDTACQPSNLSTVPRGISPGVVFKPYIYHCSIHVHNMCITPVCYVSKQVKKDCAEPQTRTP